MKKQEPHFIYKRLVIKVTIEKFTNDLALVDWNPILNSKISNEAYDLFYNEFYKSFKTNFPLKKGSF